MNYRQKLLLIAFCFVVFFVMGFTFLFLQAVEAATIETAIATGADDAEETVSSGWINLSSSDLEMVQESNKQLVGLRFNNLNIPQNATITNAWIRFTVDESTADFTSLTIEGELIGDAAPFTTSAYNISSRSRTVSTVGWQPDAWSTVGASGADQQTADIKNIVQEITGRADWTGGNSMVFIISGDGKRVAESYNGIAAAAPILHVEYNTGPTTALSFSWLPNDPEDGHIGYSIHYGAVSRDYTVVSDAGLPEPVDGRIFHTVTGVPEGGVLFFAATAYGFGGARSDYSAEIEYDVPITQQIPVPEDVRLESEQE